ncbi:MAG: hypothetical protein ACI4LH_02080, partial [Candidatus Heritagella sp.]
MKNSLGKRWGAVLLSLVLLLGCLPLGASAVVICTDGQHTPGTTLYPADWNSQTGGYGYDYYLCTQCGTPCDGDGYTSVYVGPGNGCSGGYKCHVPGNPYSTACNGTYTESFYYCQGCGAVVDKDGTRADWTLLTGHTPNLAELHSADYTPCRGGYQTSYYLCSICGQPTDANGCGLAASAPTGHVADTSTLYPANWNSQTGGYG